MYQASHTNNNNLGLLPSPAFGGQNRKRCRDSLFPQPSYKYEPPSVPNQFLPPPAPPSAAVRLGFNAYEQQATQKRVCFNTDPNTTLPGYGYGGIVNGGDFQNDIYKQQNQIAMNDPYSHMHSNFLPNNYPVTANLSMITPYNTGSISSGCSTGYPSSVYPYQQLKENNDPNIPMPSAPIGKPLNHLPGLHKTETQIQKDSKADMKEHPLSRGLQLITVNPEAISRWIPLLERFNILFEIFGCFIQQPTPFSSTGSETEHDSKMFYVKSPHSKLSSVQPHSLKCVYWEIDNPIATVQLGKIYRIIGTYDAKKSYLKSFDIRIAKMDEINNWSALVARSNRLLSKMPASLFEA